MKIKKIFPEKNLPETRTTLREQVSYIWITLKELVSYIKYLWVTRMDKEALYRVGDELGITDLLKAAAEFERGDCEKICKAFAMKERRVEVSAALNRAADMIRLRNAAEESPTLPSHNTPKEFITFT